MIHEQLELDVIIKLISVQCFKLGSNYYDILTLQDLAIDFFIKYHLETDLTFLEKLDYKDLDKYSPFLRWQIRTSNSRQQFIREKYQLFGETQPGKKNKGKH